MDIALVTWIEGCFSFPRSCVGMPRRTLLRPMGDAGASRSYTPTEDRGSEHGKVVISYCSLRCSASQRQRGGRPLKFTAPLVLGRMFVHIIPIGASLLSLSRVSLAALFEAGGRLSLRRKHGLKTGKRRVVAEKSY